VTRQCLECKLVEHLYKYRYKETQVATYLQLPGVNETGRKIQMLRKIDVTKMALCACSLKPLENLTVSLREYSYGKRKTEEEL